MNKLVFILSAIALFGVATMLFTDDAALAAPKYTHLNSEVIGLWNDFKKTHNKAYASVDVEVYRMQVFMNALNYINENQGVEYTLGVTSLADLTPEEFRSIYLGLQIPDDYEPEYEVKESYSAPASVNWVQSGIVPAILNQGNCGSCWAFSAAGSISTAYNKAAGNNNVQLSPEQLVQCSSGYGNNGCNGGWMDNAFNYAKKYPLATLAQYPYTSGNGVTGTCNTSLQNQGKYGVKSFTNVPKGNTNALYEAAAVEPVSIAVDASNWQYYQSGVFSKCGTTLDHGVILVGYTSTYWYVRNSWGTGWGQGGYIQLALGNTCGLALAASYPTI